MSLERAYVFGSHLFRRDPGEQQAGPIAAGQMGVDPGGHPERAGSVAPDIPIPVTGVGAGQGTRRQEPRHETRIGVRFTGPVKRVPLIETGEGALRLG